MAEVSSVLYPVQMVSQRMLCCCVQLYLVKQLGLFAHVEGADLGVNICSDAWELLGAVQLAIPQQPAYFVLSLIVYVLTWYRKMGNLYT